jgi:Ca2+-transporting ATPase
MRRDIPYSRWQTLPEQGRGLTSAEVFEQRAQFGRNDILEVARNPWLELARNTLRDPMIWFLIGTGIVYAVLGSYAESISLLVAILPLIGMDAFLHRRTQASTEGLSQTLAETARVWRDGRLQEIPAAELVTGDLVAISAGEYFPADGLILEGNGLQADESSLTGEAYPVQKRPFTASPIFADADGRVGWVDGSHWGMAGTRLLTGAAKLRMIYTGDQTLYGEIVKAAAQGNRDRTPLQTSIAHLVTTLIIISGVLCLTLAAVRLHQGHGWIDALVSAATLAVAALPEEFPVVFTVFLGVGVYRLARHKALVRRGVSVENIGRITCICSDKTGTMTEGRLRLEHIEPAQGFSDFQLLEALALASREETGDPMDVAIMVCLKQRLEGVPNREVIETYPYTEQRRRESAVIQSDGHFMVISKGSPELMISLADLEDKERNDWSNRVEEYARSGHKVLACLQWQLGPDWKGGEPDRDGQLVGLVAFEDPIKPGVKEAIAECHAAGIRVVMVTGDHPATATCVAKELGLTQSQSSVILGDGLLSRLEADRVEALGDFAVVARALPAQKLTLVNALRKQGEIVAVTGDGVNDVPALQAADIGIAMGERGTRSARESAAIVLLDDNFSTIVRAIAEGRQLFKNLQLSFQYILLLHIPLVITATVIPLLGYPLLYLPIHIVWYETLIHPTALLVFQELPTQERLQTLQHRQARRFFNTGEWTLIWVVGVLLTLLLLWSYHRSLLPGRNIEHARAMAMVMLNCASASLTMILSGLRTRMAWCMTILTFVITAVFVQVPWMAHHLSLESLHADDWAIAVLGGLAVIGIPFVVFQILGSKIGSPIVRSSASRPQI